MSRKNTSMKGYVTVADAAEFTGLSVATIRNLLATRELTPYRPVPGRIVIGLDELDKFVRRTGGKASTRGRKATNRKLPAVLIERERMLPHTTTEVCTHD